MNHVSNLECSDPRKGSRKECIFLEVERVVEEHFKLWEQQVPLLSGVNGHENHLWHKGNSRYRCEKR